MPHALTAWLVYLVVAFAVMPTMCRLRFGRWPYVSPFPVTRYSLIECLLASLYIVFTIALATGPKPVPISVPLGITMLIVATALQAWAVVAMGPNLRIGFAPNRDKTPLVQRGPYRFLRHPIYWSLTLVAVAQTLLVGIEWRSGILVGGTILYCLIQSSAENRFWHRSGQ